MNRCSGSLRHSDIYEAIVGHLRNPRGIVRRAKRLAKRRGMGKLSPLPRAGSAGLRRNSPKFSRGILGENHRKRSRPISILAERLFRAPEKLVGAGSGGVHRKDQSPVGVLLETAQRQHSLRRREDFRQLKHFRLIRIIASSEASWFETREGALLTMRV